MNSTTKSKKCRSKINAAEYKIFSDLKYSINPAAYLQSLGEKLFDWQDAVMRDNSRRIVIDGARQAGKSTIMSGIVCHHARFFPGSLSVILAPTLKQAQEDMGKIIGFISKDRDYPKLLKNNSEEIKLVNGARILVLTATDDAARGFSNPDIILFDEASRIADTVYNAVRPMITDNPFARIYEISTPNGKKGFFYSHYKTKSWSRYRVRAPWLPVETPSGLTLVEYKPTQDELDDPHFFFSPRHYDRNEQLEALMDMKKRQYEQEYCTEFVDAEDQVFAQELILAAFNSQVDAPVIPVSYDTDITPSMAQLMTELSQMEVI